MRKRTAYIREYILKHLDKTNDELADELCLEACSIKYHIRALKLQYKRPRKRRCVDKTFDDYIAEHFPHKAAMRIAKEINKSTYFVLSVAKRLGINHIAGFSKASHPIKENLIGQRFCKLLVQKQLRTNKHGQMQYECLCDCGNIIVITAGNLKHGHIKSCGCYRKQQIKSIRKKS